MAPARGRDARASGDRGGVAAEGWLAGAGVDGGAQAVLVDDVDVAAGEGPGFLAAHFLLGGGGWF